MQADVLTALVEAERGRIDFGRALLDGVQAERDRLLVEVREQRQSWLECLVGQIRG